ncbi:MAG: hypothetical protein ACXVYB_00285 [Arthrobacter sp.]
MQDDEAKAKADALAEAEAKAKAAAAARAKLAKSEAMPEAEAARLAPLPVLSAKAAKRVEAARLARQLAAMERADARAARTRQFVRDSVVRVNELMAAELAPAELATAAAKAGATGLLAEAKARAEFLAASGMTEAEARAAELLEAEGRDETFGTVKDAGQYSALSPAELAKVAEWTAAGLASDAARAGRQALEAAGPRAAAVIVTRVGSDTLTVGKVLRAPDLEWAEFTAARQARAAEQIRAKLATAEAAVKAAEATKASRPIKAAEAEANRVAASLAKAEAKAAKSAKLAALAKAAKALTAEGLYWESVGKLAVSEAAEAGKLELPVRSDVMPARYRDRGPSAKMGVKLTDNTARLAIANALGATAETEAAAWQALKDSIVAKLAAKAEAEATAKAEAIEANRVARRAREAAALRIKRRAAKLASR